MKTAFAALAVLATSTAALAGESIVVKSTTPIVVHQIEIKLTPANCALELTKYNEACTLKVALPEGGSLKKASLIGGTKNRQAVIYPGSERRIAFFGERAFLDNLQAELMSGKLILEGTYEGPSLEGPKVSDQQRKDLPPESTDSGNAAREGGAASGNALK